jgi:TonB family protein
MIEPLDGDSSGGFLPEIIRKWLFPDDTPPVVRRGGFVISSGPVGGGGLRIYGVFKGGNKVYTSYLPMKNKDWVLEYTLVTDGNSPSETRQGGMVVALQDSLAPPWPEKKFDFYRPAIAQEKISRTIVLHGKLGEDGLVNDLKVLQSVQEDVDRLALAAFSQWKFRPATRGGKPVGVEIMVGIPAAGPQRAAPDEEGNGLLSAQ